MWKAGSSGRPIFTPEALRTRSHLTRYDPGMRENWLDTPGPNAKVRDLMTPVLGAARAEAVLQRVDALEELVNVTELRPLLTL